MARQGNWSNQYMNKGQRIPLRERFMMLWEASQIDANGCRLWSGVIGNRGYSDLGHKEENGKVKHYGGHRLTYTYFKGPIPAGLLVRHLCHNPICVEPEHLEVGTVKDNSEDMKKAGRGLIGSRHHKAKLTELDVVEIKRLFQEGLSYRQIANRFNVSKAAIASIKQGKNWRHIA